MKKSSLIFTLITVLVLSFSFSTAAVEIEDISEDHWAYESVKNLVDKGYISLYDDNTFRGENKVTRYEMAEIINKILNKIKSGEVEPTGKDIETLRKLTVEFREELVSISGNQEDILDTISKLKDRDTILTEEIGKITERLNSIDQELSKVIDTTLKLENTSEEITSDNKEISQNLQQTRENLNSLTTDLSEVKSRVDTLEDNFSALSSSYGDINIQDKFDNIDNRIETIESEVSAINSSLQEKPSLDKDQIKREVRNSLQGDINQLEDEYAVNLTQLESKLQESIEELENENQNYQSQINELKKQNQEYKTYLLGIGAIALLSLAM